MRTTRSATDRGAFGAVEVMAASVLIALCLVPLLTMEVRATGQAGFLGGHALAQVRAVSLLEQAAALGYEELEVRTEKGAELVAADAGAARDAGVLSERISFAAVSPGLGCLEAAVEWQVGSDRKVRVVKVFKMVRRLDLGWSTLEGSAGGPVAD